MGSAKGLDKFLMSRALYLSVPKGSKPLTRAEINKRFAQAREDRKNNKEKTEQPQE